MKHKNNEINNVKQQLSEAMKQLSTEEYMNMLLEAIENHPQSKSLTEAMIVRLGNTTGTTMYGRTVQDHVSSNSKGRHEYDLHPYGKMGAGAHVVVMYQDQKETYFLLGRKEKKTREKEGDNLDFYMLPGGYVKPHPLEGGDRTVASYNSEQKDMIEEQLLAGKADAYVTSEDKKSIGNHEETFDYDLKDTALRELLEETGLKYERAHLQSLATCSKYKITNDPRLHTVVESFLLDLGKRDIPPFAKPGSDLKILEWIPASAIAKDTTLPVQESRSDKSRYFVKTNHVFIQDGAGALIEKALEVKKQSDIRPPMWVEKISHFSQKREHFRPF